MNIEQEQGILPVSISTEMKKSYLDYAMSVIVARAISDYHNEINITFF